MKRKLKWLAIVVAVSLLAFGTALLLWPRDRITAESWKLIQIGMTEKKVVEILERPGMSFDEDWIEYVRLEKELGRPPFELEDPSLEEMADKADFVLDWHSIKVWTGRRGSIAIELDEDNHVRWKEFRGVRWLNGGILDRMRDWLGW
jgi:hypothetical protein